MLMLYLVAHFMISMIINDHTWLHMPTHPPGNNKKRAGQCAKPELHRELQGGVWLGLYLGFIRAWSSLGLPPLFSLCRV